MGNDIKVGYIRVSTADQHTDRQLAGMELAQVYREQVSAKDANRPELQRLLGDAPLLGNLKATLLVHSMDRLARNVIDLRQIVDALTSKGMRVHFVKEQMTFTQEKNPNATLYLTVLGAFAEFERELILERQREGIAIAKQKGLYTGRKPSLNAEQVALLHARASVEKNKSKLAREFGISRESVYKYLRVGARPHEELANSPVPSF